MALSPGSFKRTIQASNGFAIVAEYVPWRESSDVERTAYAIAAASELARHPRVSAVSITDGAGGGSTVSPLRIAEHFATLAQDIIVNCACRGRTRQDIEASGREMAALGLRNVLCVSGDYPADLSPGRPAPRFEIDSAGQLSLLTALDLKPALFAGAVVNAHKRYEREQMPQYHKLELKLGSGAGFIVGQLGYDARKDDELIRYLRLRRREVALLSSVCVLSVGVARRFHARSVPGCVVTDDLLGLVERQAKSPDRGRAYFLELAAKQVAIARGLGYRGVVLGGHRSAEEFLRVLEIADRFGADDWRSFAKTIQYAWPDSFHYFEADPASGLNLDALERAYAASRAPEARDAARHAGSTAFQVKRLVHDLVFASDGPVFPYGAALYRGTERAQLINPLRVIERALKLSLFGCDDCGDCSLADAAYLCPVSQCPKGQRNGPCGGTRDGRCEVDGRDCLWSRVYDCLKPHGLEDEIVSRPARIADASLRRTSAWANNFLERDTRARRRDAGAPS